MSIAIDLTPAATAYINKMLRKDGGIGFRISVKKMGCSGYAYVPEIVRDAQPNDLVMEIKGITVFIDPKWQHLLEQLRIDFVEDKNTGIQQKRLVCESPKEAGRCGCGESFHVK